MSSKKSKYDVVIVGSGFSGIAAASVLAEHRLDILMVDENFHIGGQLLRKIPPRLGEYSSYRPDHIKKIGFRFLRQVEGQKIEIMNRTGLVGIYPNNRLMLESQRKEVLDISCDILLFATGARERFQPFKGWTLPGVYSTGMVQVLMKSSGVLPAREILVGGSGLFLFSVGYELLKNRGKVTAILEQTGMLNKLKMLPLLVRQFSKLAQGGKYLSRLYLSGVPVKYRRKILEARGNRVLEEVVVGKTGVNGELIPGSEKVYQTGALAVGYGFVPNIEGPQSAGCRLEYDGGKGGWIVKVDDTMETSRENILAAGEITGIGGALKSINEGKIAAATILRKFEKISPHDYQRQLKKLTKERNHHMKFVHYFNTLYGASDAVVRQIPDDTVICRCEDITMGDIKEGISNGYTNPQALKSGMRVSMGNCQGRICGPAIYDILNVLSPPAPGTMEPFKARPPLKPVSIGALADFNNNSGKEDVEKSRN